MKCQQCRRTKLQKLYSYGGMNLCDNCHEKHNPKCTVVYRLTENNREFLKNKIHACEKQIRDFKQQLEQDDLLIKHGVDSLTFTSSVFTAFRNKK